MTTLTTRPTTVDLELYAGDDVAYRFFFSTDAPDNASFVGTWVAPTAYSATNLVEHSTTFYKAVDGSTNVTPGTNTAKWVALTPLSLTGYTAWTAQLRFTDSDSVAFTVDATAQASSVISLSLTGAQLTARVRKNPQKWDLQVTDPAGKIRTLFGGTVTIKADASR